MTGRNTGAEVGPAAPEDRSWAARVEALKRERPAQAAIAFATVALLAALLAWVVVLIPAGGNIRANPKFWLLAAPLFPWLWGVQSLAVWAVRTLWLALGLAPCLSLLALFVAQTRRQATLLDHTGDSLDTPAAMVIIVAVTTALAIAGLIALRRSSLPGGARPISYVPPETPVPGAPSLSPGAIKVLQKGTLPFSGAAINGVLLEIVATMEPVGPGGGLWAQALVAILVLCVGILVFRGGFRLARRRPGAARDLRRGWRLGIGYALAAIPALWAWPIGVSVKVAFSCFMGPAAFAASWFGSKALGALPSIMADAEPD